MRSSRKKSGPKGLLSYLNAQERAELDRLLAQETPKFLDPKFPEQSAFIADPARLKLEFCTRRAGKSFGLGRHLFRDAYETPGTKCLYLAKTRDSAKGILWTDVMEVLNDTLGLQAKPNLTELSWTLPNRSVVRMLGADADQRERNKLLGQKYKTVAIDEAEAFDTDVTQLVYKVLKPAVADHRGTIILSGTPANLKAGMFFELTKGQEASSPGVWTVDHQPFGGRWSGHRWSAFQNPYMREQWAAEIADLKAVNPLIEETPIFQQDYLGRWTIDDDKLVYRYRPGRNDYDGRLPIYPRGAWHYVLAIDLGFNDACSFTVLAYHDHDRTLYVVSSYKKAGLDITATSEHADALKAKYDIEHVTIDGANKQAVAELNNRHGLAAVAADKTGKPDFIDIMNAEFIQERIKLSPDCGPLKEEYSNLIWDERQLEKLKRVEHPGCENHSADGTLYGWRWCWQYLSVVLKQRPQRNTAAWFDEQRAAAQAEVDGLFDAALERNQQEQRQEREADEWL